MFVNTLTAKADAQLPPASFWGPPMLSALVLGLAGWGDALLYPTLPLNAAQLGVSLAWVGVLLSINKFIRLGGNYAVALAINRLGYKPMVILGAVLATLTTLSYGLALPIWMWLIARVGWGMAFAALQICVLGYATEEKKMGVHLGLSKAIHAAGPMLALILGPLLVAWTNMRLTFILFGLITAFAIPLAFKLPYESYQMDRTMSGKFPKPRWLDGLIFATALVDGILIVTLGILLLNQGLAEAAVLSMTALILATKRLGSLMMGPLSGWLADRWKLPHVFLLSIGGSVIGLFLISTGITVPGAIIVFISNAVHLALSPGVVVSTKRVEKLIALSAMTTWRDLGTACGTLAGGILLMQSEAAIIYLGLATLVLVMTLMTYRNNIKQ